MAKRKKYDSPAKFLSVLEEEVAKVELLDRDDDGKREALKDFR